MGYGEAIVVYGDPGDVPGNSDMRNGQKRYLGWDTQGNLFTNWKFPHDVDVTGSIGKRWITKPWDEDEGMRRNLHIDSYRSNLSIVNAIKDNMIDTYTQGNWLNSYNRLSGNNWTVTTLLNHAIILTPPTSFSPGSVQMWSMGGDGKWWYQTFPVKPLIPIVPNVPTIDLTITYVDHPAAVYVNDPVTIKVTAKNLGDANSGPFEIGLFGVTVPNVRVSNLAPSATTVATYNTSFATKGLKNLSAKVDITGIVQETNEDNNVYPFQIMVNVKGQPGQPAEPVDPIAIISHLEGDNQEKSNITIKPNTDPKLGSEKSYSPDGSAIVKSEWRFKPPIGENKLNRKPTVDDFAKEGTFVVELRVTNANNRVSEWTHLTIQVDDNRPPPKPEIGVNAVFVPSTIITGETSTIQGTGFGYDNFSWSFSPNLQPLVSDSSGMNVGPLTFSEPGVYSAKITVTNSYGDEANSTAFLTVIDPRPTAVVSGISRWIQGRPLPRPYDLLNSFTPLADRGVTINHDKDEMRYKKEDADSYTSGWPTVAPTELGNYSIEGKVYDSQGRVSEWGSTILEVVPDQPPVVELVAPEETYRNADTTIYIDAYSPDNDNITYLKLEERYDSNNDGNFEDESWRTVYDGDFTLTYKAKYTTVGKRQYRATVKEEYGLSATSNIVTIDVLNLAPTVNFNAYGITQQPGQDPDSGPPVTNYAPESILRSWVFKKPYTGGNANKVAWKADASTLSTKAAVKANFFVGFPDSGKGANAQSRYDLNPDNLELKDPWRLSLGDAFSEPNGSGQMQSYQVVAPVISNQITSTGKMLTVGEVRPYSAWDCTDPKYDKCGFRYQVYDANSGTVLKTWYVTKNSPEYGYFLGIGPDENIYTLAGTSIVVYDFDGQIVRAYPGASGLAVYDYQFSSDGKSIYYVGLGLDLKLHLVHYSLQYQTVLYNAVMSRVGGDMVGAYLTLARDGSAYVSAQYKTPWGGSSGTCNGCTQFNTILFGINPSGVVKGSFDWGLGFSSYPIVSDDGSKVYTHTLWRAWQELEGLFAFDSSNMSSLGNTWEYSSISFLDKNLLFSNPVYKSDGNVPWYNQQYRGYMHNLAWDYYFTTTALRYWGQSDGSDIGIVPFTTREDANSSDARIENNKVSFFKNGTLVKQLQYPTYVPPRQYPYSNSSYSNILPNGSMYIFTQLRDWGGNQMGEIVNATQVYPTLVSPLLSKTSNNFPIGKNADTVEIIDDDWGGLTYDPASKFINQTLEFNVGVNHAANDKTVGAAIQIQDEKNMYAVEWTNNTLSLYRVVNGTKTLLQANPLNRSPYIAYPVKIESVAGVLKVFVNNVLRLEVNDNTFTKGSAGIMSLGQQQASFSNMKRTNYGTTVPQPTYETALVGDPIMYEKLFIDIEGDPKHAEEWTYRHNQYYFENPEGVSAYDGKTFSETINALDKPGKYEITFRAQDDPGFEGYRLFSEPVTKTLYVHRRPVAVPNVTFTGIVYPEGEALDYLTNDQSYDLDVPGRLQDRLFRTRWGDETNWTYGQRNFYNRPGVELIIQEQVQDIHGAWSYWAEQRLYKDALNPINQTKPSMMITVPNGTATNPTVYLKDPTTHWNYYDAQNDPQEMFSLTFTYVDSGETAFFIQQASSDKFFEAAQGTFDTGRVIKVQGRVFLKGAWSDPSNIVYFIINKPPIVTLLNYNGPDADHPIYINSNQPLFQVSVKDPENDPIRYVDYETFLAELGLKVVDTETATSAISYKPTSPLPEGLQIWRARAHDGYQWGPYSTNGFFFVDTVQPEDTNEVLDIKPTSVKVTFDAFKDAAPSSGHDYRRFYMQKVNADGSTTNIDLNGDGVAENYVTLPNASRSYEVGGLIPGQTYRLMVVDWDRAGNMGKYAYIYFVTNRPPTGDFGWTPTLVYEGDTVAFRSEVDDPDHDDLDVIYELVSPSGEKKSYSYVLKYPYPATAPTLRTLEVGDWTVTMTVSDRIAPPVTVRKTVKVWPLGITGAVRHTEAWEANRLRYNEANPKSPRPAHWFWAGEAFVLEASVTDTGASETKPLSVTVQAEQGLRADLRTTDAARPVFWKGTIQSRDYGRPLTELPEGPYTFVFKVKYSNGIEKTAEAGIVIRDTIDDYVQVHRVQ